jgi:Arginine repressor
MIRERRQQKILDIISRSEISTQKDLMAALLKEGYDVTQATVSRDIRELGLEKANVKGSGARYVKPLDPKLARMRAIFHETVLSVEGIGNLIVIKTVTGGADSACVLVDGLGHPEIAGSLAGDDTIVVVVRNEKEVKNIVRQFELLTE